MIWQLAKSMRKKPAVAKQQQVEEKKGNICNNPECEKAGKVQNVNNFYKTNSSIFERYPVCKQCIQKMVDPDDISSVQRILKELNIAYISSVWLKACNTSPENPFGSYIRQMNSLPQYQGLGWNDDQVNIGEDEEDYVSDFKPTDEMIIKWGRNHAPDDYLILEDFYNSMKDANDINNPQDIFYLKKLSLISLKLDKALEGNRFGEVKQLGELFSKYMADSKFRAMDKTDADMTGGVKNFSAIYSEIEKDDYIPPWKHYEKIYGAKQDIIDKTIMYILNFVLKLNKIKALTEPPEDTPKEDDS
jgi:hypothetical protein